MLDDGMVKVHPPVERVFRNLVAKLEAAGHEVIEWDSSLNSSIIDIMVSEALLQSMDGT
jgi:Asp-tRNA(Asn)/Glu-tRNA(Gln) amidotransferase A subunit family amidase